MLFLRAASVAGAVACTSPKGATPSEAASTTAPSSSVTASPAEQLFVEGAALGPLVASLAHDCSRASLVPTLLGRAATLSLENEAEPFEQWNPLAQVLGYCDRGNEHLLTIWLERTTGRGRAAARALAAMASRSRRLDPGTVVALLRRPELEETWFALSQLDVTTASLRNRLLEQAVPTLKTTSLRPYWVLRALALAGDEAVPLLIEYAADRERDLGVRTAAAVSLAAVGRAGQQALATLVDEPDTTFATTVLGLLDPAEAPPGAFARRLAGPAPATLSEALLRCRAAAKVSPLNHFDDCAPAHPRLRQLAWLDAFARREAGELRPSRRFRQLFEDGDPVVVQAALEVLARTPKRPEYDEALRRALAHENPGVVARAAEVLSSVARSHPALPPSRETLQALKEALLKDPEAAPAPTSIALLRAVASLEVLSLRGALPRLCEAKASAVRRAVDDTLAALHADGCPPFAPSPAPESAAKPAARSAARLRWVVEGQELVVQLAPDLPSETSSRLLAWLRDGGFDGTRVVVARNREWLRVGDAEGDDYPDARAPRLSSVPRGAAFGRYSVALWQHGLDAASPQLVIALEDRPDFDADHTWVGTASPDWERVPTGALVTRATAEP